MPADFVAKEAPVPEESKDPVAIQLDELRESSFAEPASAFQHASSFLFALDFPRDVVVTWSPFLKASRRKSPAAI